MNTEQITRIIALARAELIHRKSNGSGLGRAWMIIEVLLAELDKRPQGETK